MSITEAGSNLATTWQEQTDVAFTAGTLSSITDMVTEVESKLKRGTLTASTSPSTTEVQRWITRAKEELSEIKKFSFKRRYAYASTVASTYRYALPPDYNGGDVTLRDTTGDRKIVFWTNQWFDSKFPDPSAETSDEPVVACIKGMELWLAPPPGGVYTLELEYGRSGGDNTGTDVSWLPEIERFRCCDFAVSEAFESLHMYDQAAYFRSKWNAGLAKAIKADGKRRWKSVNYSALSIFEEYRGMYHQQGN